MVTAVLALLLALQEPAERAAQQPAPAGREYRIGAEDGLRVTVFGHPDLTVSVAVDPDGSIKYPLLGRVEAAGRTPRELEASIADELRKGFIRNPQVSVAVEIARSKRVFVVGEVAHPGWCPAWECGTVMEALSRTGPLLESAGAEVVVVRPGAPEVLRVDLGRVQSQGSASDLALQPGDTVMVPRSARVFVSGQVEKPGAYPITPGTTVRQAISLAGGFGRRAVRSHVRILRPADNRVQELRASLEHEVQAGDTVVVERRRLPF
jgi:polysaccharide export outer membrane protein